MADKAPHELWFQAGEECGDDTKAQTARYLELMREAGHLIDREEGDMSPLFECGYDPRKGVDPYIQPDDPAINKYKSGPDQWPGVD